MAKTLVEEFLEGVGNAVRDVREKVAEEPWFGRTVTDNIPAPTDIGQEPAVQAQGPEWPEYLKDSLQGPDRDDRAQPEPDIER